MPRRRTTVVLTKAPTDEVKSIVEYFANGYSTKDIAAEMDINLRTLEAIIGRVKAEFNCLTIPQLVATFLRNNLIA